MTAARALRTPARPVLLVGATAAVAAVALLAGQGSPNHAMSGHHRDAVALAAWFTVSWLLMATATMLPTSLPLLSAFTRLLGDRRDAGRLVAVVVAGYLGVWTVAGLALAGVDLGLHRLTEGTGYAWMILPATLLLAGGYQLSGVSAQCLRACRSPFSFLATRWSGRLAAREAALIGLDHGLSCLGCCAALMLVMSAVGMSNPLVMIALGGVAALHKYARWGAELAKVTGVVLVLAAVLMVLLHGLGPTGGPMDAPTTEPMDGMTH
jgi:predicted metal-binding membrane protein